MCVAFTRSCKKIFDSVFSKYITEYTKLNNIPKYCIIVVIARKAFVIVAFKFYYIYSNYMMCTNTKVNIQGYTKIS